VKDKESRHATETKISDRSSARQPEGATAEADAGITSAAAQVSDHPDATRSEGVTIEVYFGSSVRKRFTDGYFKGLVTLYIPQFQEDWYQITYENGNQEDLDEDEVRRLMLPCVQGDVRERTAGSDSGDSPKCMHFSESFFFKQDLDLTKSRKDQWVCCTNCEKWRMIPPWINRGAVENLEDWSCHMNKHDHNHNHCAAEERHVSWYFEYFHKIIMKRKQLKRMNFPPSSNLKGSGDSIVGISSGAADAATPGLRQGRQKRKRKPRIRYIETVDVDSPFGRPRKVLVVEGPGKRSHGTAVTASAAAKSQKMVSPTETDKKNQGVSDAEGEEGIMDSSSLTDEEHGNESSTASQRESPLGLTEVLKDTTPATTEKLKAANKSKKTGQNIDDDCRLTSKLPERRIGRNHTLPKSLPPDHVASSTLDGHLASGSVLELSDEGSLSPRITTVAQLFNENIKENMLFL